MLRPFWSSQQPVATTTHYPELGNQVCLLARTRAKPGVSETVQLSDLNLPGVPKFLPRTNRQQGNLGLFPSLSSNPNQPSLRDMTKVGIETKPLVCGILCSSFQYLSTYHVPNLVLGTGQTSRGKCRGRPMKLYPNGCPGNKQK